jgi:hypothetical protein
MVILVEYHDVDSEILAGVDKNGWSSTFVVERELGNNHAGLNRFDSCTG